MAWSGSSEASTNTEKDPTLKVVHHGDGLLHLTDAVLLMGYSSHRVWVVLSAVVSAHLLWGCQIERHLIFYPESRIYGTPQDVGLAFDEVFFTTRDGIQLNGWFVPGSAASPTLLWFHGNAGNISHRLENIMLLHDKVKVNIFIFDYRGYGRSEGTVSEEGTYLDAEAAVAYLRQRYAVTTDRLVLFGRSLGAAVATEMATRMECLAVILESPFTSIRDMARETVPFLPVGLLLKTRYDVVEKVAKIHGPLLVLHGELDEVVPMSHGKKVFAAAPQPKTFYSIAAAGHNDTYRVGGDPYFEAISQHIAAAAGRRSKIATLEGSKRDH